MDVVLVEDSYLIAGLLRARVDEVCGARVVGHAATEDAAVECIMQSRPDAVILDLNLAKGSGLRVLQRIRAKKNFAKVFVLTNFMHKEIREACLTAGALYFFDKSTQFEACLERLSELAALAA
jgi:DNA-binding NarL/FixJ family response regulator